MTSRWRRNQPERRRPIRDVEAATLDLWAADLREIEAAVRSGRGTLALPKLQALITWVEDKRRGRRPASDAKAQRPAQDRQADTRRRGEEPDGYDKAAQRRIDRQPLNVQPAEDASQTKLAETA